MNDNLGITIETLLGRCDDADIDERSKAGESLNQLVHNNLPDHLNTIQLTFYKELRKNGSNRSIRAALSRFAELAHLFRPIKRRPYLVQLIPVIEMISARTNEEAIQETISTSMRKIMPVFGPYATKDEIISLLNCFLSNLAHGLPLVRRTAAISLSSICQHSRKPSYFYSWLIQNLLRNFHQSNIITKSNLNTGQSQENGSNNNLLSGIFICLKHILPLLADCPSDQEIRSSASSHKQKQVFENLRDNLLQMYELVFHSLRYSCDNSVVISALEALLQLKNPPKIILSNLFSINGLGTQSKLSENSILTSLPSSPSLSCKRIVENSSIASSCDNVMTLEDDEDILISSFSRATKLISDTSRDSIDFSSSTKNELLGSFRASSSLSLTSEPDSVYDESIISNYDDRASLRYTNKMPSMTMDGIDDETFNESLLSPCPSTPSYRDSDMMHQINGIGDSCSEDVVPLEYCARLLCARFLLSGTKGSLISDRAVRKIWEIILYSSHPDPHLKSQASLVIANFLKHVLELPMSYNEFISINCAPSDIPEAPSLEELIMNHIFPIILETSSPSPSIRNALQSLQICLPSLIKSQENVINILPKILTRVIPLKDHNYWLVKAGLLDLLSNLPFRDIVHLGKSDFSTKNFKTLSSLQATIIDDVFLLSLSDEDHRVRASASNSLVNLVQNMFSPDNLNNGDPVIAVAENLMETHLSAFASQKTYNSSAGEQFPLSPFSSNFGFVFPFGIVKAHKKCGRFIETNLKVLVEKLMIRLKNHSDHKYTIFGCLRALHDLSLEFPVTFYPKSWSCEAESIESISSFLEYLFYLSTNCLPLVTDLSAHQAVIGLLGNLLSGIAYQLIHQSTKNSSVLDLFEKDWGYITKDSPKIESIYSRVANHAIKLLSIFAVVFDENRTLPNPLSQQQLSATISKANTMIPSLSTSTFSPRRRKSLSRDGDKSENLKKSSEKDRMKFQKHFSFMLDPILGKLFEIMRSINISSKISLDLSQTKLLPLLRGVLDLISQLLEIAGARFFIKNTEEMLLYLSIVLQREPQHTVRCTRQLLKCIFALNFHHLLMIETEPAADSAERDSSSLDQPMDVSVCSFPLPNFSFGLYQAVIATPYSNFSDYCISGASSLAPFGQNGHNFELWHCYFKRTIDKRITHILLEKSSFLDLPGGQTTVTKLSPTSYIRVFESIVSKVRKLYILTSSVDLQHEILSFICLLLKLRIDYNLLDPEHVFLNFVRKQIEFIEKGNLGRCDHLIESIFNFFLLISYSREHQSNSLQPIITVPEIITMCHSLMASEQPSSHFAIPALKQIVEDLMLHRVPTKVESAKELEAQREVAMANLLKLSNHCESLQLLILAIHQARKEGEDKWRKISRQVIDAVLPSLTRQTIHINSNSDLEIIHQICDSVSPAVFRPTDYLLRALFTPPDNDFLQDPLIFQRWISSILVILRVLIMQAKEEIVLARLDDLLPSHALNIKWMKDDSLVRSEFDDQISTELASVTLLAEFLLNVVRISIETLVHYCESSSPILRNQSPLLVQQLSSLLLYLTHMFQSGSYRRVAKRTSELLKEMISRNSVLGMVNSSFSRIDSLFPTLMFQWCNILTLLGFDDHGTHRFWYKLIKGINSAQLNSPLLDKSCKAEEKEVSSSNRQISLNVEMIRRAALILMCDFICENINDVEHLTWLVINNIHDIIQWSYELPIRDFIHSIHRNQASSGLFLQAVAARCNNFEKIAFLNRLLRCIELSHETQSGSLISLIINHVLLNPQTRPHISIRLRAEKIAINRIQSLLKLESSEEALLQLSLEDSDKFLESLISNECRDLIESLEGYRAFVSPDSSRFEHLPTANDRNSSVPVDLSRSKDWFLDFFPSYCKHDHSWEDLIHLLEKLSADELNILFSHKTCGLGMLTRYTEMLIRDRNSTRTNESMMPRLIFGKNHEATFKICLSFTRQHMAKILSYLPNPHYTFATISEMFSAREIKHRGQLIELFEQQFFREYLLSLAPLYTSFISLTNSTNGFSIDSDMMNMLTRIYILYAEIMSYDCETTNFSLMKPYIQLLHDACECDCIVNMLNNSKNITFFCSLVSSIHVTVRGLLGEIRTISLRKILPEKENLTKDQRSDYRHLSRACDRALELLLFLNSSETWSTSSLPSSLLAKIRRIIAVLCRVPLINSLMMVPTSVWSLELWKPDFWGDYGTQCSIVPSEYIRDKLILKELVCSIKSLGWINRVQFEELWMSLLGVISPLQEEGDISQDDKLLVGSIAISGITSLILHALNIQVGNPLKPGICYSPKRQISFMHTKFGEKLSVILHHFVHVNQESTNDLEKVSQCSPKMLFSVDHLRKQIGVISDPSPTSSSSSSTSSTNQNLNLPSSATPDLPKTLATRDNSQIDLGSCIHFLLELYGQLIGTHLTRLPLITEVCKSLCFLSDLFFERAQYEWYLNTCLELFRLSVVNEDDMNLPYITFGITKAAAVLAIDQDQTIEKCKRAIEAGLKSQFLPTRIYTLRGLIYLFERKNILPDGKESLFLPTVKDYLLKHLNESSLPSSHNEEHVIIMWNLSFHLIENFSDCSAEDSFPQKIFQTSIKFLHPSPLNNSKVYEVVSQGLERLVCCEIFTIADGEIVMKVVMDKLESLDLTRNESFCALRLMVTCIYVYGLSFSSDSRSTQPNEDMMFAMERVRAIFDRMKNCGQEESHVIAAMIPSILCDFLPTQDVLNKIISEFLVNQHILPHNMGSIVYKVFSILRKHSEDSKIRDWILLSLSSFTQMQPLSSAMWTISCFLISASTNVWVHNLFRCLMERVGLSQKLDEELFVVCCCCFYDELPKDEQRRAFYTALEVVAQPGNPYAKVLLNLEPVQEVA
ncbi:huntingtin isoform X2 [Brevipalpus obovatus]|uniref:huntingtin isoform X2 n=1 Tax=Brevipalpus obovatus TaxID=246614 RepID=UPI003D9E9A8E